MAAVSRRSIITSGRFEATIVLIVLLLSAYFGGGRSSDWFSAIAVFLSFACTQIAFDLAELAQKTAPDHSPLTSQYRRLYVCKELFWIVTCIALQNYPLIASTVVFASYPYWRKLVRDRSWIPSFVMPFGGFKVFPLPELRS